MNIVFGVLHPDEAKKIEVKTMGNKLPIERETALNAVFWFWII